MRSPTHTRVPADLVRQAREARPELADASVPTVIRAALAYLAGRTLPEALRVSSERNIGGRPRKPVNSD